MKNVFGAAKALVLTTILLIGINPKPAAAGWMDNINQATQTFHQIQSATQAASQAHGMLKAGMGAAHSNANSGSQTNTQQLTKTDNPIKGEWGTQVTCEGPNSATCANGMDDIANCMHQTKGYYYRLVAANLEEKFKNDQNMSDEQRKDMQADIASVKDAINTGNVVDPDPNNSQRWLKDLTDEDQMEINRTNSKYMREVHDDCEARFGGMSRYSSNK